MNIQREYLLAAIPEAIRVFGVLLRPYSLGHNLILTRFGSPFVCGGKAGLDELLFAAWVCARTFGGTMERLSTGRASAELARWKRILNRRQWFGLRPLALKTDENAKLFTEYLDGAQAAPNLFVDEGGKPIGSPSMQVLKVRLMKELHITESEVLNRPLALCWWDYATLVELSGHGKVYDRDEYAEAQRKADEWTEKFLAERKQ